MEVKRQKNGQIFMAKLLTWILAALQVFCGHFYTAIFILWSASVLHKEVISIGHILQKDQHIALSWLDWYWYAVGAYICIPYAFLRRNITESLEIKSELVKLVLYHYHSLISSVFLMVGALILMIKLNRGYVKY